jgi:D-arginine dehydrogenase
MPLHRHRRASSALRAFAALPDVAPATRALGSARSARALPLLREGYVAAALLEPDSSDIDVSALHQGYLRLFRRRAGRLVTNAPVEALERGARGWTVHAGAERFTAPLVVNAAGAWADEVAALAGLTRVGLQPRRRTAVLVDPPPGMDVSRWPFVNDIDEQFYFKPEAGSLFLSPADETPVEPSDAQPDEWDVATAVERVEAATTLQITRLKARWAGLRTFAPDRTPVVGFSERARRLLLAGGPGRLRHSDRARAVARRRGPHPRVIRFPKGCRASARSPPGASRRFHAGRVRG